MNYIWGFSIIIGICFAVLSGNLPALSDNIFTGANEAVSLCISMLGAVSMWSGIMEVGRRAGLINRLSVKIFPLTGFLFPDVPKESKAMEYLSMNLIANFLGLGWAATPAGINAMKELHLLNKERDTASDAMCNFLIINISSVQLIPINIIAYRAKYGSVSPSGIIVPSIIATFFSTITAIIFIKLARRRKNAVD